jgi:hypothetical protein
MVQGRQIYSKGPGATPGKGSLMGCPESLERDAARRMARRGDTGLPRVEGVKGARSVTMWQPRKSTGTGISDVARVVTLPLLEWFGWLPLTAGRAETQVFR